MSYSFLISLIRKFQKKNERSDRKKYLQPLRSFEKIKFKVDLDTIKNN